MSGGESLVLTQQRIDHCSTQKEPEPKKPDTNSGSGIFIGYEQDGYDFSDADDLLDGVFIDVAPDQRDLENWKDKRPVVKPSFANFTLDGVMEAFKEWVTDPTYILLRRTYQDWYDYPQIVEPHHKPLKKKEEYIAVKACKRGNDVYSRRLDQRFKGIEELLDVKVTVGSGRELKTRALHVTLTHNQSEGLIEAWQKVGKHFNLFMANLRKRYGRVSVMRSWESFENGFPHIHAVLLFHSMLFHTFKHRNKKGRVVLRVLAKHDLEAYWHSFVDVEGVESLVDGFHYLDKYLRKAYIPSNRERKAVLTKAMLWYFNKRSYAVSGAFYGYLQQLSKRLDQCMHNSNLLLDVSAPNLVKYAFLSTFSAPEDMKKWFSVYSEKLGEWT